MIKEIITNFLEKKECYEAVDEMLIDEVVFNYEIMAQCKKEMRLPDGTLDLLSDITRDPDKEPFLQKNRLLDIYNTAFKNVKDTYVKLSLTVQERNKLKIALIEAIDEFGNIFD